PGHTAHDPTHALQQHTVRTAHAGKHIWSLALSHRNAVVATGGADGGIALRSSGGARAVGDEILGLEEGPGEGFKAYRFVGPDALLATTTGARLVLVELNAGGKVRITGWGVEAMGGLRGYSVVVGLEGVGVGWVAGLDGKVLVYARADQRTVQVWDAGRKVAGLFAQGLATAT
ncbi:WD repeat-containing protein 6, partial [Teratosphaeriaceae sp. CCFEE 6253]